VDLYDGSSQAVQSGPTLQTGQWYLIDMRIDAAAATWTVDWRVDGQVQPGTSWNMGAAATFVQADIGVGNSQTAALRFDDYAISGTASDFPIGNGRTYALHTDGRASGGVGANFGPAPESAWAAALAQVPMTATTAFLEQVAITDANTDHVAFTADDPDSTRDARAVRGVVSYGATAADANDIEARVRRPGDTLAASSVVFDGNAAVTPLSYGAAMIPAPTGGWTQSNLANTDWLVGFSTDVTPAPRVHDLLLEVEYRG
jgi:hypothetical protein